MEREKTCSLKINISFSRDLQYLFFKKSAWKCICTGSWVRTHNLAIKETFEPLSYHWIISQDMSMGSQVYKYIFWLYILIQIQNLCKSYWVCPNLFNILQLRLCIRDVNFINWRGSNDKYGKPFEFVDYSKCFNL